MAVAQHSHVCSRDDNFLTRIAICIDDIGDRSNAGRNMVDVLFFPIAVVAVKAGAADYIDLLVDDEELLGIFELSRKLLLIAQEIEAA